MAGFKFPIIREQLPIRQFLHELGISGFDPANLNERQYETNRYGVLAIKAPSGRTSITKLSYVSRYTSVHFTPDPIGDLVFNGVASNVFQSSFSQRLTG